MLIVGGQIDLKLSHNSSICSLRSFHSIRSKKLKIKEARYEYISPGAASAPKLTKIWPEDGQMLTHQGQINLKQPRAL